jgi:anti-sigma B factor antagonist
MRLFDVEVTARPSGGLSMVLTGELDLSTIEQLEEAVSANVDGRPELVVVDLRKLEFLDSTGLRLMLRLHSSLRDQGGRLVMVEGPRRVHRVFELTRAVDELEIVADPTDIDTRPDLSAGKPS